MAINNFQGTGWNGKTNLILTFINHLLSKLLLLMCSSCIWIWFIIKILNYLNSSNIVLFVENLKIQVEMLHLNTGVHFNQGSWKLIQTDFSSKIMFMYLYKICTLVKIKKKTCRFEKPESIIIINKWICPTVLLHTCYCQIVY